MKPVATELAEATTESEKMNVAESCLEVAAESVPREVTDLAEAKEKTAEYIPEDKEPESKET